MRIIQANKNKPIALGFQGENDAVTVQFDVKGWADLYGAGYFTLLNQRPTESVGYPCTVTVADEVVSWVVSYTDVFIEGTGHVQLTFTRSRKKWPKQRTLRRIALMQLKWQRMRRSMRLCIAEKGEKHGNKRTRMGTERAFF